MRHQDVQGLLAGYAAATLDEADAERVRAHLASGCVECLGEVFGRSVGLPREATERPAGPPGGARSATWPWHRLLGGAALVASGIVAAFVLGRADHPPERTPVTPSPTSPTSPSTAVPAPERPAADAERARLVALLAAERARLEERTRELETARKQAADAEAESEARAEALAGVDAELAATRRRADELDRRVRDLGRAPTRDDERTALEELLSSPGAHLLPLRPVGRFRDVRGHALWHPGSEVVVVYGFGLPRLPGGRTYHVRVDVGSGEAITIPRLRPDAQGRIVAPLHVGRKVGTITGVRIARDPGGDAVLAGREPASTAR